MAEFVRDYDRTQTNIPSFALHSDPDSVSRIGNDNPPVNGPSDLYPEDFIQTPYANPNQRLQAN
jgi:hypothetical protein